MYNIYICLFFLSPVLPPGQVVQCVYQHNWDQNGVLYFLGRMAAVAALQQVHVCSIYVCIFVYRDVCIHVCTYTFMSIYM